MALTELIKNSRYHWRHDPSTILVYKGYNWSGNGYWHQFEKVGEPGVVWCEITDKEIHLLEDTTTMSTKVPTNEVVNGHKIRCYDKPDTVDRYTVIYMGIPENPFGTFMCVGMNETPFHPAYGFGQHSSAAPGKHLGKRIRFADLPEDCRKVVERDLETADG